jgi:hypothetical protein
VVLIGHGTFDGIDAKFNLVGPDLTARDWKSLFTGVAGQLVVVNTTEASFPFVEELSLNAVAWTLPPPTPPRSGSRLCFPEYFVKAFADPSVDFDKNGRVSVWEAFAAASAAVKRHYEERGQLTTERPLLDDDGDRVGREAETPVSGRPARTADLSGCRHRATNWRLRTGHTRAGNAATSNRRSRRSRSASRCSTTTTTTRRWKSSIIELVARSLDKVRNRILTLCWCNAPALRWSVQYPFLVGAMPNRIARRSLNEVLDCTRAAEMKRYINGSEAAQAYSLRRRLFPSD